MTFDEFSVVRVNLNRASMKKQRCQALEYQKVSNVQYFSSGSSLKSNENGEAKNGLDKDDQGLHG
jgi:hypothetical protein